MLETIREAICQKVGECFPDVPVYDEEIPQKGKLPCFNLHLTEVDMLRRIGRYQCTPKWKLCYHAKENGHVRMDTLLTGMQLLRKLEMLYTEQGPVRTLHRDSVMQQERMELTFETPYQEREEETADWMQKEEIKIEEEWR